MSEASGNSPTEPDELAEIFGALLEAADPAAVLNSITNPALRAEAEQLWRSHTAAESSSFLAGPMLLPVSTAFSPGQSLSGRFTIEKMLGVGGMGEVYLASDQQLGVKVAIKTISPLLAPVSHIRRRFLAEVQNARRITHRNICRIYEYFEDPPTGAAYFVMEYLNGPTLDTLIQPGMFTQSSAQSWLIQLAMGLQAAHDQGILHGDFKPGNIIVTSGHDGRAVITDFGLARALNDAASRSDRRHSIQGATTAFTAPEILSGGPPSLAGDLYAYGRVAALLLPQANWWKPFIKPRPTDRPPSLKPALSALQPDHSSRRNLLIGGSGLAVIGYLYRERVTTQATLPKGTSLLVNGITSPEPLRVRARTLRNSFMLGLQQSPRLRLIDDRITLGEIRKLGSGLMLPAAGSILQQLLEVTQALYWIDSTLSELAGRLSWRIVLRRSSDGLAVMEQQFASHGSALRLAEDAAVWFRTAAGESQDSLSLNSSAVGDFTSQVPEALDRYSEAIELYYNGGMPEAIYPFQEAVRLDPNFAQAHAMLGMCHNLDRRVSLAVDYLERAMSLAAKLPPREKSVIAANYYKMIEDPVGMVEESRKNVSWRPDDPYHHRQLANHYCWTGAAEQSLPAIRRAIEVAPRQDILISELLADLCEAGRYDEALAELQRAEATGRDRSQFRPGAGLVYLCKEDYVKAQAEFDQDPGTPSRIANGPRFLSGAADVAISGWTQGRTAARAAGITTDAQQLTEYLTGAHYFAGRESMARRELQSMPELPLCPPHARRLQTEIFWASRLAEPSILERAADSIRKIAARWPNAHTSGMARYADAVQARLAGDYARAGALIAESAGSAFSPLTFIEAAEIAALEGKIDVAGSYWTRFESLKGTVLKLWFPGYLLYGWQQALQLAQRRGNQSQARNYAQKILGHWGAAQPQSLPVRSAKQI